MSDIQRQPSNGSEDGLLSESDQAEVTDMSSEDWTGFSDNSDSDLNPALQFLLDAGFLTVETLRIKIGGDIRHISRQDLLGQFWTNGLDTPCMVCGGDFDDERGPTIRTLSIDEKDYLPEGENFMLALSERVVHIQNRHLECTTKLGVHFITVFARVASRSGQRPPFQTKHRRSRGLSVVRTNSHP